MIVTASERQARKASTIDAIMRLVLRPPVQPRALAARSPPQVRVADDGALELGECRRYERSVFHRRMWHPDLKPTPLLSSFSPVAIN